MAKYNIKKLNYISTGEDRSFINIDTELDYEIYDYIHFLCAENSTSGYISLYDKQNKNLTLLSHDIGTELRDGYYHKADYIQKECSDPLAEELSLSMIILNEQLEHFIETDPRKRKYIRLYLSCCTIEMKLKIDEFNRNRTQLNSTFVIDKLKNEKNNLTCLNNVLLNMYDIKDISFKKQGVHDQINNYLNYLDYHHDIYAPSMESGAIGFCLTQLNDQYKNDVLVVTYGMVLKPFGIMTDLLELRLSNNNDIFYHIQLKNFKNDNYTYNTLIDRLSSGMIDHFIPKRTYQNIKYSFIVDIPVDNSNVEDFRSNNRCKYDNGEMMYYKLHIGKNAYNSLYTMDMSSFNDINNCRTYKEINSFSGLPYLKYYDDITYKSMSLKTDSNGLINIQTEEYNSITGSKSDTSTKPFQKIELLYPTDYTNNAKHKSNIFTVDILSTGIEEVEDIINEKDGMEEIKRRVYQLKTDIHSAIKEISKSICPANTLLFNVYFGGNL